MKYFAGILVAGSALASATCLFSQTVAYTNQTISAKMEIAAANQSLPDASGLLPAEFDLPANASVLTMTSVTGTVTLNDGGGYNDPDGVVVTGGYGLSLPDASYASAYGGISGIKQPGAGALVGVFESSTPPVAPPPATLDFTTIGNNFTNFAPALNQLFYIGDGLTGDGSGAVQQFIVPAGATRLYLGISDASGFDGAPGAYNDNSGNFTASFQVAAVGEPVSDDFTNNSYYAGWTFVNLNTNSTATLTGTDLDIEASPLNGGSDLYSGSNYKAPRLLQPVDPNADWIVETKFYFNPQNNYSGAGILLATTNGAFTGDNNFARMGERAYYPDAGGSVIGVSGYVPWTSAINYLRIQKTGTNYNGWYSADGTNWTYGGLRTDANVYPWVGLFVIRYPWDGVMVNSSAQFYYFHVTPLPISLGMRLQGANAVFSWPEMAAHFNLLASPTLPAAMWTTNTNDRTIIGSQLYVTNGASGGSSFFQLRYP
jgi:hypothetical protein